MDEFFRLSMPWWHFVLRAAIVYVVILAFVRLSGKRTLGQFTTFDTLLLILIGTAVQNSLIGDDVSLAGGLILAATHGHPPRVALGGGPTAAAAGSPHPAQAARGRSQRSSAGISNSAPSMLARNMKLSRMPMSAWNFSAEKIQVPTPTDRVTAVNSTAVPVVRSALK